MMRKILVAALFLLSGSAFAQQAERSYVPSDGAGDGIVHGAVSGYLDANGNFVPASATNPQPITGTVTSGGATSVLPAPTSQTAAVSSVVLKNSPGQLDSLNVGNGAVTGCVMLFDATSAPVDGAVTPKVPAYQMTNANASLGVTYDPPLKFSTGITAVYSSTCGLTKTASATAFISGQVQ